MSFGLLKNKSPFWELGYSSVIKTRTNASFINTALNHKAPQFINHEGTGWIKVMAAAKDKPFSGVNILPIQSPRVSSSLLYLNTFWTLNVFLDQYLLWLSCASFSA